MGDSGSTSADSYIGSVISLTSKSEIRYEGTLYTVDTENSNIALQNVRSFGTEGRKKEGPQIPASDKVYEYIIFRGTDIKDLQVKSSPPVQAPAQHYSDPAIISLQAQQTQAPAMPPAYRPAVAISVDQNPSMPFTGVPAANFQNGVPSLYQPAGSWGPLPPPGANGTGLAMPLYWTGPAGFYRPQTSPGHLPQQQHPLPHSVLLPPIQQSLLQPLGQPTGPTVSSPASPRQLQSSADLVTAATSVSSSRATTFGTTGISATSVAVSAAPMLSSSVTSSEGISAFITPASKTPRKEIGSLHPPRYLNSSLSTVNSDLGFGSPKQQSFSRQKEASGLVSAFDSTSVLNSKIHKEEQKLTESLKSSTQVVELTSLSDQQQQSSNPPLLPLPTATAAAKPGNVNAAHQHRIRRTRGRGRTGVVGHAKQQFMEEFDFIAMNEKFNKDEVWGELGKGDTREVSLDEEEDCLEDNVEESVSDNSGSMSKPLHDQPRKPVYVKDEFFDSLSCESLERGDGRSERTKFSEQRKIETETFGSFPTRSRSGRMRVMSRGNHRSGYYVGRASGGKVHSHGRGRGAMRAHVG